MPRSQSWISGRAEPLAKSAILVLGEVVRPWPSGDDAQMLGVPTADGRLRKGQVTSADYAALIA